MNSLVVVDASLVVKWLVEEEDSDTATALGRFWRSEGINAIAPHFMIVEVANALYQRVLRGHLSAIETARLLEHLMASVVELRETSNLYRRTLELASQLGQGAIYDSHYLALAESLNCHLWTADERFFRAAAPVAPNIHRLGEFVASP